jgi:hypothetical protein
MECEAEKAALAAAPHERPDVEEGRRQDVAAFEDDDLSALQRQKDACVPGVRDRGGLQEPGRESLESDFRRRLAESARRERRQCEPEKSRELPIDREFLPAG